MDRDVDALIAAPATTQQRLWLALGLAVAVITTGALAVRTFPDLDRQAGHDAVLNKGVTWARGEVEAAPGVLGACDALQREAAARQTWPEYDYGSFITGCGEAVDHLLGRHVPLLPSGD